MSWVKQRKLPAVEAICFQGQSCNDLPDLWSALHQSCNDLPDLWSALHQSYNAAADHSIDFSVLDKVPSQATRPWTPFSMLEIQEALKACSNVSALGPDHITWRHLKLILASNTCAVGILSLANACLSLWYWPRHFKKLVSIIIPKPGKPAYNTPRPLGLLFYLTHLASSLKRWLLDDFSLTLSSTTFSIPTS